MFSQNRPLFLVEVADPTGGGFCRGVLRIGKAGAIHSLSLTDSTLAGPLQVSLCKDSVHQPGPNRIPHEVQHVCVGKPTSGPSPYKDRVLGDSVMLRGVLAKVGAQLRGLEPLES